MDANTTSYRFTIDLGLSDLSRIDPGVKDAMIELVKTYDTTIIFDWTLMIKYLYLGQGDIVDFYTHNKVVTTFSPQERLWAGVDQYDPGVPVARFPTSSLMHDVPHTFSTIAALMRSTLQKSREIKPLREAAISILQAMPLSS